MSTLVILAAFAITNLLLTAYAISLTGRMLGARRERLGWALLSVLLTIALTIPLAYALKAVKDPVAGPALFFVGSILLNCVVICLILGTTLLRSVPIWLASLVPTIASLVFAFFVLQPYILEAFVVPSNNMAPTIVGWHRTETCPNCGGKLVFGMTDPESYEDPFVPPYVAICDKCLKIQEFDREKIQTLRASSTPIGEPDRIFVNKLLTPRRWDVIEFRYPPQPTQKYIMRLVALPGEKVFLKDGAVWANGVKLEMPKELEGLRYGEDPGGIPTRLGTEQEPLILGPNDYAVLGDFTDRSADSRIWGKLPGNNIEGVVTVRYAPLERWKILR